MMTCFKGRFRVTSPYGMRTINGTASQHCGIDLVGIDDTTVYAPCDGVIGTSTIITDKSDKTWEWGNYVRLDASDGKHSIYLCHLASRFVKKGQRVKRGDKLGIMGNTGYSFGAHTHFEVRKTAFNTVVNASDYSGIPNIVGEYGGKVLLESGNDIVWELMNNPGYDIEISEPERAVAALEAARLSEEFLSLYWIIFKIVNRDRQD